MVGTKTVSKAGLTGWIPLILLAMYLVAAGLALAPLALRRSPIEGKSVFIGVLAGISTASGMACSMMAAALLPAYIAFPVFSGGTLLLVALAGRIVFVERIGPYGIAGILVGVCAIILLST
jgi:drug/metabolite transporter (DMT)-like permease